ncbi:MAG: hypothetical protein R2849_19240 [Thermomicrobiales bacterium]
MITGGPFSAGIPDGARLEEWNAVERGELMRTLTSQQLRDLVPMRDAVELMKAAFETASSGKTISPLERRSRCRTVPAFSLHAGLCTSHEWKSGGQRSEDRLGLRWQRRPRPADD